MRTTVFSVVAALGACTAGENAPRMDPASWEAALGTTIEEDWRGGEHRTFDFWIGEWEANWRPQAEGNLQHADEGAQLHHIVFPILGGKALVELAEPRGGKAGAPSGRGFSIRYFDPARARWVMAQHWPGPNFDGIAFTDQLIGFERHGRMQMYSVDTRKRDDGGRNHRRYNFSDIADGRFRWDGSNTSDVGKSWTTWQVVEFDRTAPIPPLGTAGTALPFVDKELLCQSEPHGAFDGLEGVWEGVVATPTGSTSARFSAGRLLDGCAIAGVFAREGHREFAAWSYSPAFGVWTQLRLDDRPGTTHRYFVSESAGQGAEFVEAPDLAIRDDMTAFLDPANFDTTTGLRRTVFRKYAGARLVIAEETRDAPGDAWRELAVYSLTRR
jgi:hypothetical protein